MATAHFTDAELFLEATPPEFRANAQRVALLLESLRALIGRLAGHEVRLRVTNLYSPRGSGIAGRVQGSCHETASAADVVMLDPGPGLLEIGRALEADPPPFLFGEAFVYPIDGHIHITLPGCGGSQQVLARVAEGGFSPIRTRRGQTVIGVVMVVLLLATLLLLAGT